MIAKQPDGRGRVRAGCGQQVHRRGRGVVVVEQADQALAVEIAPHAAADARGAENITAVAKRYR